MRGLRDVGREGARIVARRRMGAGRGPARALAWIRAHELPTGGIRVHTAHPRAYPEVTGYLVPTLVAYGQRELARRCVRWLVDVQRPDGSYTDPDHGRPFVFDTAQALRGLLAGMALVPEAEGAARKAADFLVASLEDGGAGGFACQGGGDPAIPETIHLYALPPLLDAATTFARPAYAEAARRCAAYYERHEGALRPSTLTHFLAYELDGLIDLGAAARAREVLDSLVTDRRADGAVPARAGATWVCTPAMAQLAVCWYKIGRWDIADQALAWLEQRQEASGGFRGSYGRHRAYFPDEELSWACKFYLDAHRQRLRAHFDRSVDRVPSTIAETDGRLAAIVAVASDARHILEVGCGKGRLLAALRARRPEAEYVGVDLSPTLLAHVPAGITTVEGTLEAVPLPDASFDLVFSVEAIEHVADAARAVSEMARVTRPGGWVVVIDKQRRHWGRLACPPWESWPEADAFKRVLERHCDEVAYEPVSYDGGPADGLMLAWRGRKRAPVPGGRC